MTAYGQSLMAADTPARSRGIGNESGIGEYLTTLPNDAAEPDYTDA
jgi:hypothetical protein